MMKWVASITCKVTISLIEMAFVYMILLSLYVRIFFSLLGGYGGGGGGGNYGGGYGRR